MYQQYEVSNDKLIAVRDYVTKLDKIFPVYLSKITSCGYKLKQYPTVDEYVSYNQNIMQTAIPCQYWLPGMYYL